MKEEGCRWVIRTRSDLQTATSGWRRVSWQVDNYEQTGPMCAGDHDRFLLRELWAELMVDKMVKLITCHDNLLPGFPTICAVGDTGTVAIDPKDEKSMAQTTTASPEASA